jgi:RNA polymerase sigma-70 factor (ECF subfamily)
MVFTADHAADGCRDSARIRIRGLLEQPEDIPDVVLLRRAGDGERNAFAALYARHAAKVRRIAGQILRDEIAAEDVCQEAFLRLWIHGRSYREERGSVGAWLSRIARNLSVDEFRRRRSELSHTAPDGSAGALLGMIPDREPGPERIAMNQLIQDNLLTGLQCLPPLQSQAVKLSFLGEFTHREIAKSLDQPLGTVKYRISRGLMTLRSDQNLARVVGES